MLLNVSYTRLLLLAFLMNLDAFKKVKLSTNRSISSYLIDRILYFMQREYCINILNFQEFTAGIFKLHVYDHNLQNIVCHYVFCYLVCYLHH